MVISLIDDHLILAQAMKGFLLNRLNVKEVNNYESIQAFLDDIEPLPDIIIIDIQCPHSNGVSLLQLCRDKYRGSIIVLSAICDILTIRQCMHYGASAYLSKAIPVDELLLAINEVIAGNSYIECALQHRLSNSVDPDDRIIVNRD